MSDQFIGIDVGGTKIACATLQAGELSESHLQHTELSSGEKLVDQLIAAVEHARTAETRAVGIGVPSLIEFATGRIRSSVNIPLEDVPLRELLTERCGLPVYVDNDASCAALAEAYEGGRVVAQNLVMLTIGTGVGGGMVLGGKVYRGNTSAAELGHIIIGLDLTEGAPADPGDFPQPGSLERLASGRALDRLAVESARAHPKSFLGRRLAAGEEITGYDAVEGAQQGDIHCRHVIRVLGERLGVGIGSVINIFDPDEIVIGGGVSAAGELLLKPAERTARRHTVPGMGEQTTVRLARHGPQAGVLGAATMAAQEYILERTKEPV